MPGRFIALDGLDGTGKSTQCQLLAEWLRGRGHDVVTCRDPGGTPLGDALRPILFDHKHDMTPAAEAMLFMASRAELVARVIRPALAAGQWVVSDRYLLANVVYQGHAGGLNVDELWNIGRMSADGVEPDLTLVLDLPVERANERRGRTADRFERRDAAYQERVRQGFLAEARRRPDRIVVVDASPNLDDVQQSIRAAVERLGIS
jgi:dTMP kinase